MMEQPQKILAVEEPNQSTGTASKRRRVVSFAPKASVRPSLHINNYTKEEIEATWYNAEDYYHIRMSCADVVNRVLEGKPLIANDHCVRGLERKIIKARNHQIKKNNTTATSRNKSQTEARQAVLVEQARQVRTAVRDDNCLANVYMKHSSAYAVTARRVGHLDYTKMMKLSRAR